MLDCLSNLREIYLHSEMWKILYVCLVLRVFLFVMLSRMTIYVNLEHVDGWGDFYKYVCYEYMHHTFVIKVFWDMFFDLMMYCAYPWKFKIIIWCYLCNSNINKHFLHEVLFWYDPKWLWCVLYWAWWHFYLMSSKLYLIRDLV